jgi:hypothetical protein
MDRFAVRKAGKNLLVNKARLFRNDQQGGDWASAKVTV